MSAAFETASRITFARGSTSGVACDLRYARLSIVSTAVDDDDYDPRMHMTPKQIVAPWMAHFNLLRTTLGPEMLGMPVAISNSGLLLGSVITVISGVLLIHMYTLLVHNLSNIASQLQIPYIPYRYGFRLAVLHGPPTWARIGRNGPAAFEATSRLTFVRESPSGSICDVRKARLLSIPIANDYDPRMHRQPTQIIAPWMAHFNLLRTTLGPGLLGMPVAISNSGLVLGSVITVISGVLLIHMYALLLNNLSNIAAQLRIPHISYRYGFRAALLHGPPIWECIGRNGPAIIGVFMILSQVGICTVCVILTADSLRDVADFQSHNEALLILLPFYLLEVHIMKTFKRVTYMGFLGNALNLTGLVLIFFHIFKDTRKHVCLIEPEIGGMLFTFGMGLFNLSSLGVIMSLDKCLVRPQHMTEKFGVLNVSLGIPTVLSVVVGTLAYWAFGVMEENVLRYLPYEDTTAMISMSCYMISVSISYPLHCYPAIGVIEEIIKYRNDEPPTEAMMDVIRTIVRPMFVMLTFTIAYFFPFQGPFVAFVGNLCTSMISLVFPTMMDISLRYGVPDAYGKYYYYLYKDVIILLLGLTSWVFGVYFCGRLIYIRILASLGISGDSFL